MKICNVISASLPVLIQEAWMETSLKGAQKQQKLMGWPPFTYSAEIAALPCIACNSMHLKLIPIFIKLF
jgi:hypothetical protein